MPVHPVLLHVAHHVEVPSLFDGVTTRVQTQNFGPAIAMIRSLRGADFGANEFAEKVSAAGIFCSWSFQQLVK